MGSLGLEACGKHPGKLGLESVSSNSQQHLWESPGHVGWDVAYTPGKRETLFSCSLGPQPHSCRLPAKWHGDGVLVGTHLSLAVSAFKFCPNAFFTLMSSSLTDHILPLLCDPGPAPGPL